MVCLRQPLSWGAGSCSVWLRARESDSPILRGSCGRPPGLVAADEEEGAVPQEDARGEGIIEWVAALGIGKAELVCGCLTRISQASSGVRRLQSTPR